MSEHVRAALAAVVDGRSLHVDEARLAMGAVMDGEATPAQLAALLVALRMRGETVEELAGFASAMRERVLRVEAPEGTIDVVGTGGDGSGTFNISTAAALLVASTGVPVAKHGNRAITSRSGSADVLDALGVRIDHSAESAGESMKRLGFAFLFAPTFHPAMRHAGPTRREIRACSTSRSPSAICPRSQSKRSWSSSRISSPDDDVRAARRDSCSSISARSPTASGSGSNSTISRPRRIASAEMSCRVSSAPEDAA